MQLVHGHTGELSSYCKNASPLGLKVASLLALVYRGIYHLDPTSLQKTDWSDTYVIAINIRQGGLATVDYNELTQLVVLAHDLCIRVAIDAVAPRTLRLMFHQRTREGSYSQRHPTLEEHAEKIRATFTIEQEATA